MMDNRKRDFRCIVCRRLLARISGDAEIKCPRCGTLNLYRASTGQVEQVQRPDRASFSDGNR